ncbi:MAG: PEGA domain-containing protein [Treponema sp.]|jgi:hypothetical protein|nr:PEGA domain-containing protein [Treponema sp.]
MTVARTIFLFQLLFLFPFMLTALETFEEKEGRGLEIKTNPSNVKVFINGIDSGETPYSNNSLPPGQYNIRLSREGYNEQNFWVTLFSNSRLVVTIDMNQEPEGSAHVSVFRSAGSPSSLPLNPQIYSNTNDEEITAVSQLNSNTTLINLHTGLNSIKVRAFGWEDETVTVSVSSQSTAVVDIYMKPAAFRLQNISQSRRRFNPSNPGSLGITEYRFEVSAPGSGFISITDSDGSEVFRRRLDQFSTWVQNVTWDGRDSLGEILPEGIYTVLIEASPLPQYTQGTVEPLSLTIETEINYSANIFPLSLDSGLSGLTFSPLPHTLPAGSYQVKAGILYGSFYIKREDVKEENVSGMPFNISMRIAPLKQFEMITVFNINPYFEDKIGWGVSGSAKYNIINGSGSGPLMFAAGVSYYWASEFGEYPLSPGRGVGIHTPLSLELSSVSIAFCPAVFWRGPEGLTPELLLSAGLLYRGSWLTWGISTRFEFDFTENPRIFAGAELHLFPPPSNLVFSLHAGILTQNNIGGYGGLAIGFVF